MPKGAFTTKKSKGKSNSTPKNNSNKTPSSNGKSAESKGQSNRDKSFYEYIRIREKRNHMAREKWASCMNKMSEICVNLG